MGVTTEKKVPLQDERIKISPEKETVTVFLEDVQEVIEVAGQLESLLFAIDEDKYFALVQLLKPLESRLSWVVFEGSWNEQFSPKFLEKGGTR